LSNLILPSTSFISFSIIQQVFYSINHHHIQTISVELRSLIFHSSAKMQFKIVSVIALAAMAAALPTEDIQKRTDSQDAANKCSQTQTLKCCNQVAPGINLLPIGVDCVSVNCKSTFYNW
jgi:hypothetical protein